MLGPLTALTNDYFVPKNLLIGLPVKYDHLDNIFLNRQLSYEKNALHEGFREKVGYFEINELNNSLDSLKSLKENLSSLGFMSIKKDII